MRVSPGRRGMLIDQRIGKCRKWGHQDIRGRGWRELLVAVVLGLHFGPSYFNDVAKLRLWTECCGRTYLYRTWIHMKQSYVAH
jgi:hypothetical protein